MKDKLLQKVGLLTGILFVISIIVFFNEHKMVVGDVKGSYLIKGVDPQKIEKIVLVKRDTQKTQEQIVLKRDGDFFRVENVNNYPADNQRINDLLFTISNAQIEKKVGSSKDLAKKYKVSEEEFNARYSVYGDNNETLIDFYIGEKLDNKGNCVRLHSAQDSYLLGADIPYFYNADYFINKSIFKFLEKDLQSLHFSGSNGALIISAEGDDSFVISGLKKEKLDQNKIKSYLRNFLNLKFEKPIPLVGNDLKEFKKEFDVELLMKDELKYHIAYFSKQDKFFIQVSPITTNLPEQVSIRQDATSDEVKKIDNIIQNKGKQQRFALMHGAWIYEISKFDMQEAQKNQKELLISK